MTRNGLWFLLALTLIFPGCSKRSAKVSAPTQAQSATPKPLPTLDACALLTSDEIKNIAGEAPTGTTPSHMAESGFDISQCLFNLPEYSNSILVSITRRGTGRDARDPKKFLEERIEHPEEGEREEEDKPRSKPEPIEGLGDKAIWEGTKVGGALYVIKGNLFVRVAVGTFGGAEKRKEKVIELARLVVKRL
jgi:hypothetical protein